MFSGGRGEMDLKDRQEIAPSFLNAVKMGRQVQVMSTPEKPYPPGRSISHKGRPSLTGPAQELGATFTRQRDRQGSRFTNENSAAVDAKTWAPGAVAQCN